MAAGGDGKGEEARGPGEESPPGEERGGVHGGADERGAGEGAAEELQRRGVGLALALEELGLGDAAADPEGEQRGENAGEEDGSPAEAREDERGEGGSEGVADGPETLHEGERFAAGGGGEGFGDECGSGGPFSSHAEAEDDAAGGERERGVREAAGGGGDGVDEQAGVEGDGAAEAVGEPAEEEAAGGCGEKRRGHHRAGERRGQMEVALHGGEDHRVEHDVHAVEHPAEGCGGECSALGGGCGG